MKVYFTSVFFIKRLWISKGIKDVDENVHDRPKEFFLQIRQMYFENIL